jgi:hypothetical protein
MEGGSKDEAVIPELWKAAEEGYGKEGKNV